MYNILGTNRITTEKTCEENAFTSCRYSAEFANGTKKMGTFILDAVAKHWGNDKKRQ